MANLYFDNASTSFPKPLSVAQAMLDYMTEVGGTYARGAYPRILQSSGIVEECRALILDKIDANPNDNLVFTSNATEAANILLFGLGLTNCRILVSPLEHNAIMRPLEHLRQTKGITWEVLPAHKDGRVNTEALKKIDTTGVELIIINHQSNLNGVIQPIAEIKQWAKDIKLVVDASQSLGTEEINASSSNFDYLIFTGHKGLHGPTGTGGLYFKQDLVITPTKFGGTSTLSHSIEMPTTMPDSLEAGTPNMVGIAGLLAALKTPILPLHTREDFLEILNKIKAIKGLNVYCAENPAYQGELFSVNHNAIKTHIFTAELYDKFKIECRSGLHCAPLAHQHLKTAKEGSIRFSLSPYHTPEDLLILHNALQEICK